MGGHGVVAVDGGIIRRSPVEVGSLSHYLPAFSTIPGGDRRISGCHQQYGGGFKHIFWHHGITLGKSSNSDDGAYIMGT